MDDNSIFRKEAVERLSSPEQLDQLMRIINPRSWLPLAALGGLLTCGLIWSFVGRIPVTTTGRGALVYADAPNNALPASSLDAPPKQLVGVAYFSAGEIAQIEPGMEVLLIPDVEGAQVAGGLMATVDSVSEPSITTIESARENRNEQTYVEVVTIPDKSESGDYAWSTGSNDMAPIAGMPAIARVTLKERAPITFVFPFLGQ
ncbi:hypothetical protein S7335_2247 [Synechococcus sp. PCC 7335]|uniref:hypothetical protein n=1 Tax=Synechococcus sp. (strain ATCC 29403 / PCC 7335) TaxID=91464 RepID=UPI00017EE782|nr:hypothetical protein [Synechococcus sp. PCC 7335]EDX84550.1 hypothetical protein S7335_2247 [Synechococcus sp. PCC 7335]